MMELLLAGEDVESLCKGIENPSVKERMHET